MHELLDMNFHGNNEQVFFFLFCVNQHHYHHHHQKTWESLKRRNLKMGVHVV